MRTIALGSVVPIERIDVNAFIIPTNTVEADGTLSWNRTSVIVAEAHAGGECGLGYTYGDNAVATLIQSTLRTEVEGRDALAVTAAWDVMVRRIRNLGRPGISSMAIAAVDVALWDLKARLLNLPLARLLGMVHNEVPVYGSGGFTSYSIGQLQEQLSQWVQQGIAAVKMKIGARPQEDVRRVQAARKAIGNEAQLFVDANGAYSCKQALAKAEEFTEFGVSWFEEPVSSDDLEGLRLLRDRAPAQMEIAAGEYGYDLFYFQRMLQAGAVDVLQADATRCAGITGLLRVGALCEAHCLPLSTHTAPALHLHPCCAMAPLRNIEYFYDHVRIEKMFFDGVPELADGRLRPDLTRSGMGLEFKRADAVRFAA